ncbi:hypothetical protein PC120_g20716 [Phytophthora cactorum]|nr:hypothetical protein PC120_g20716 [Phytophthora cactorum]
MTCSPVIVTTTVRSRTDRVDHRAATARSLCVPCAHTSHNRFCTLGHGRSGSRQSAHDLARANELPTCGTLSAYRINSVYYGVDAFSPTLVDFYTVDQKRIVWSSRAHRKMMTTLYRAWHGKTWKVYSLSFWASLCGIVAFTLFITGATGEAIAHSARSSKASWGIEVHSSVDLPLLLASLFFLAYHAVTYLEVINCK